MSKQMIQLLHHFFILSYFLADRTSLKHSLFVSMIFDRLTPLCFTMFLILYSLLNFIFLGKTISELDCCSPRSIECLMVMLSSVLLLFSILFRLVAYS